MLSPPHGSQPHGAGHGCWGSSTGHSTADTGLSPLGGTQPYSFLFIPSRDKHKKHVGNLVGNLHGEGCARTGEGCLGVSVLSLCSPSSPLRALFCGLVKFSSATAV